MANTLIEKAYWRDPVQVFSGASWGVVGLIAGLVIGYFCK